MPEGAIRKDMNAWDVLNFMDGLVERATVCHDRLRAQTEPPAINTALVSAVAQLLASLDEALVILSAKCPNTAAVRDTFGDDLKVWINFRHDAAHVVDRMFRESLPGRHSAAIVKGSSGAAYMVLGYQSETDEVATGDDFSTRLCLREALERALELCGAASQIVHDDEHNRADGSKR